MQYYLERGVPNKETKTISYHVHDSEVCEPGIEDDSRTRDI